MNGSCIIKHCPSTSLPLYSFPLFLVSLVQYFLFSNFPCLKFVPFLHIFLFTFLLCFIILIPIFSFPCSVLLIFPSSSPPLFPISPSPHYPWSLSVALSLSLINIFLYFHKHFCLNFCSILYLGLLFWRYIDCLSVP